MSERSALSERPLVSRLRAGQWFAVAGGVLAALLIVCCVLGAAAILRLADARNRVVDELDPAQIATLRLSNSLLNQETGLRGYALTGDRAHLEPFESGRRSEGPAREQLHALTARLESARIDECVRSVEQRIRDWKDAYVAPALASPGEDTAATAAGNVAFQRVRQGFEALSGALAAERETGRADLRDAAHFLTGAFVAIAALLVLASVIGALLLRGMVSRPLSRLSRETRRTAGGEFAHAIHGDGARDIVDLGEDIGTLRRRITSELDSLRDANERLDEQALDLRRSNAELEQFAYVASHDLQEPLRKVASFTQLLQRRYGDQLDERADQYIEFAVDGAKRMQQLINDLLAFSRVGRVSAEFTPADCAALVRGAMSNLAEAIEEAGATIEVGTLPWVRCEPSLLTAVFQNLIANAVKFRADAPPVVQVSAERVDSMWRFTVSDNGIGIDLEYADRIFVIFQRLHPKEAYGGTGIGLAMCRKIVEFHGGHIELDTSPGDGTTFHFTIPALEESE